jgi:hypothetical protein
MPRFNQETVVSAMEVQQLIVEWGYELDLNNAQDITGLCTDDCTYFLAGKPHVGHALIKDFYAARNERVRTQQKDSVRTQRHTISNFRTTFEDADNATVNFLLVNYSKEGTAPALDLVGPTIVADCRMQCRRGADGEWLISLFDSTPVFIGNDPFLNASVVRK